MTFHPCQFMGKLETLYQAFFFEIGQASFIRKVKRLYLIEIRSFDNSQIAGASEHLDFLNPYV